MKRNYTKDEKFMLCLFEEAQKSSEMDTIFDRYDIGKLAGITPKGVDAM